MIKVFPAESRFSTNHGWLKSNFSFSFAEYYDPNNMNFGPMRVLNDDSIEAETGFGMHPHRDMEIATIVLQGELQHQGSMGHTEILRPGEVQRMSAGTGVLHSEVNSSSTEELRLFQMWFEPQERGLTPSYEQKAYDQAAMKNALLPVVTNAIQSEQICSINQDMSIYLSELEAGKSVAFEQQAGRKIFFMVIEGEVTLNGEQKVNKRDSARITEVTNLEIQSESGAFVMLIDLP